MYVKCISISSVDMNYFLLYSTVSNMFTQSRDIISKYPQESLNIGLNIDNGRYSLYEPLYS